MNPFYLLGERDSLFAAVLNRPRDGGGAPGARGREADLTSRLVELAAQAPGLCGGSGGYGRPEVLEPGDLQAWALWPAKRGGPDDSLLLLSRSPARLDWGRWPAAYLAAAALGYFNLQKPGELREPFTEGAVRRLLEEALAAYARGGAGSAASLFSSQGCDFGLSLYPPPKTDLSGV